MGGYLVRGGKIQVMRALLYHTLNCLIIDEYRKKTSSSLDVLLEKGYEPSSGSNERIIIQLDGANAMKLISQLPEKYRTTLKMRYVDHLSLTEISSITGQTKNAIAVQIHRGLTKLKALYTHKT